MASAITEIASSDWKEINEERQQLYVVSNEKLRAFTVAAEKERETRKQMKSTNDLAHKLLAYFVNWILEWMKTFHEIVFGT